MRNAVRFIGHDGMFEVPFFVETAALSEASRAQLCQNGFAHCFQLCAQFDP